MDLNPSTSLRAGSGLTQALSDGTNAYIYGNGRIAQVNTTTEYFLGDALGSVRQLTNPSGQVTYARAYDPYGTATSTSGASSTAYGYTGEFTSNELVYLRARMYAPAAGRFLTRDTWGGDVNSPMSLNRWNYVDGNPINRIDPSGHCWYPNLQTGGVSIDPSDPSSGICSWFTDVYQQNGVKISTNATPGNWVDSLPAHLRSLVSGYAVCVGNENQAFLTQGSDFWMVIRFYTKPKWEYYQARSTTADLFELTLGIGVGGSLSCDNSSKECTLSGGVDLGGGGSVLGFKLKYSVGIGGEWDTKTGSVRVGGTADVGPCDLFVGFTKISIGCTEPMTLQTFEVGWTRDALPEMYWVLAKASAFGTWSYEDYAETYLPFHGKSKIYYRVEDTNQDYWALWSKYLNHRLNNRLYEFK